MCFYLNLVTKSADILRTGTFLFARMQPLNLEEMLKIQFTNFTLDIFSKV